MSPFSVIRYLLHFPTGVCVLGQASLCCRDVPTNSGQMPMFKITIWLIPMFYLVFLLSFIPPFVPGKQINIHCKNKKV